jgi:multiple sugar transport system substrate-binding protein
MPPPDLENGSKIGGGSWQWAVSSGCEDQTGAMEYMKFAFDTQSIVDMAKATKTIPANDQAAARVEGFGPGRKFRFFLDESRKYALIRPPTPAYPFIATEFTKTVQDILSGADPDRHWTRPAAGHARHRLLLPAQGVVGRDHAFINSIASSGVKV